MYKSEALAKFLKCTDDDIFLSSLTDEVGEYEGPNGLYLVSEKPDSCINPYYHINLIGEIEGFFIYSMFDKSVVSYYISIIP